MEHFVPGPSNTSLLRLQDSHVSKYVWNGEEITFRARCNFWMSLPNKRVLQLIRNTVFGPMLDNSVVEIDNHLLTAMVERWRSETHTFHLPNGECTITLQNVAGHIYCEELTNVIKENQRQSTCQLVRSFSRETGVAEVEAPSRSGGRHLKVYTVYGLEFQPIGNEEYWPSYYGPSFIPNPIMRRKRIGRPKTTRIHNEMDEVEPQLIKKCG
ncbi:hypothetical protein Lal_00029768 [Lupinus albus]|nr:hypothetical protein Lal_00029768 [Lupinus albus]